LLQFLGAFGRALIWPVALLRQDERALGFGRLKRKLRRLRAERFGTVLIDRVTRQPDVANFHGGVPVQADHLVEMVQDFVTVQLNGRKARSGLRGWLRWSLRWRGLTRPLGGCVRSQSESDQ
jgi:hypothetical protein